MILVICPGVHDTALTQAFLADMRSIAPTQEWVQPLVFPAEHSPTYSSLHVLNFLVEENSRRATPQSALSPVLLIGFSAGVVGAIGAAWAWQGLGGVVMGLIAIDGWGVPLYGNFPIHRISHDRFTYWSSALLGAGESGFYAEPAVEHLQLWRSPHSVQGWWVAPGDAASPLSPPPLPPIPRRMTAAELIAHLVATTTGINHSK